MTGGNCPLGRAEPATFGVHAAEQWGYYKLIRWKVRRGAAIDGMILGMFGGCFAAAL